MRKIGIISDLHGTFDEPLYNFLADVDEIWCAGDIGSDMLVWELSQFKPLRAVYGNMDGWDVRGSGCPGHLFFECEKKRVLMTHIGFQGGIYTRETYALLMRHKPDVFVSGHSHILKIFFNHKLNLLNINPGACGRSGIHKVRTAVRFVIDGADMRDMEVGEWPR